MSEIADLERRGLCRVIRTDDPGAVVQGVTEEQANAKLLGYLDPPSTDFSNDLARA